jgi:large subunit ribosomal protein L3
MAGILGKKVRMTQIFGDNGESLPVTIISAGPCYVTQIKTKKTDGYEAIQIGYSELKEKHMKKPQEGHSKKANAPVLKYFREFTPFVDREVKEGEQLGPSIFSEGETIAISAISKGRGFQGVMKRHGFSGSNMTHGQSDRQRAPQVIQGQHHPGRTRKPVQSLSRGLCDL